MKILKFFLLSAVLLMLSDCQKKTESSFDVNEYLIPQNEPLPELSIFNLPSDWVNQHGKAVKLADFRGKPTIMVMIYTSCQAACPRLTADMSLIHKQIPEELRTQINFVFVSIDPLVDTPEKTTEHLKKYHLNGSEWHFLTGTEENTRQFSMVLGVKYKQISPIDFSHSNIISLFDLNGNLVHQISGLNAENQELISKLTELGNRAKERN